MFLIGVGNIRILITECKELNKNPGLFALSTKRREYVYKLFKNGFENYLQG
jgi:hypothetical protein